MENNNFDSEFWFYVVVGTLLWIAFGYGLFDGQHIYNGGGN